MQGINIFSGEKGLGGALTNPTVLARRKGSIEKQYPVTVLGKSYQDAEIAYQEMKCGIAEADDEMMANVISQKLLEHPELFKDISARGGTTFLKLCTHITFARTEASQAWEGRGTDSRFIRNLVRGYEKASQGLSVFHGQTPLF